MVIKKWDQDKCITISQVASVLTGMTDAHQKKEICMKCMSCVVGCDLFWSSSSDACETWWHGFPQLVFSERCQYSCFCICSQQPLLKAVRAEGLRSAKAGGWTRKKHFDEAKSHWSRQTLLSPKVNRESVKRTSPDTAIHEQNGYAKVYNDKYTFKTNVDNDDSDTTYMTYTNKHKHNMREV